MPKYLYVIAVALFLKINCFAQHGLAFNSHEVVLEKRTSLDLSPEDSFCFTKNFELSFDINFIPNNKTYFGYVIRIISNGNQNIDLIFDQKSKYFKEFQVIIINYFIISFKTIFLYIFLNL